MLKTIKSFARVLGLASVFALSTTSAFAAQPNGSHIDYKLKVDSLVHLPAGVYIYFDTNHQCGSKRAFLPADRTESDRMISSLMTAQAAGLYVSVDLRDEAPGGICNAQHSQIAYMCVGDANSACFTGW